MSGYLRLSTPKGVERQLRQEAGFGCARCGHPYIEYHHIVPYAEDKHFRPEDMVALCGNCHPLVHKFGIGRQREIKRNPFNLKWGWTSGALHYEKDDLIFKVGGNWFENTPTILRFHGNDIITCRIEEGQVKVSLVLYDQTFLPIFRVVDNEITFRCDVFWDFEYKFNFVALRRRKGCIALQMDFSGEESTIRGEFLLGGMTLKLGPEETDIDGFGKLRGGRVSNCAVGINVGNERLLPANFAQAMPQARWA